MLEMENGELGCHMGKTVIYVQGFSVGLVCLATAALALVGWWAGWAWACESCHWVGENRQLSVKISGGVFATLHTHIHTPHHHQHPLRSVHRPRLPSLDPAIASHRTPTLQVKCNPSGSPRAFLCPSLPS